VRSVTTVSPTCPGPSPIMTGARQRLGHQILSTASGAVGMGMGAPIGAGGYAIDDLDDLGAAVAAVESPS
jgi:hypothetical protein